MSIKKTPDTLSRLSKALRLCLAFSLMYLFASCDKEATESAHRSWVAAPRILSGELSEAELASATYVEATATMHGQVIASSGLVPFANRRLDLSIPEEGTIEFALTGYFDASRELVMWKGVGTISSWNSAPGKTAVTLSRSLGLAIIESFSVSNIEISGTTLTPFFDKEITDYTTDSLPSTTATIGIDGSYQGSDLADVFMDCNEDDCSQVPLTGVATPVTVRFFNKTMSVSYQIVVLKQRGTVVTIPAHDTALSGLSVSGATLSPFFSPSVRTYKTDSVASGTSTVVIAARPLDEAATVTCNGGSCASVALTGESTPVQIAIANGESSLTYLVYVLRKKVQVATSGDTTLSSLVVNGAAFSPGFDPYVTTYVTDSLPNATTSVSITATPTVSSATVSCTPGSCESVPLASASTVVKVIVTNGTKKLTYWLNVLRKAERPVVVSTIPSGTKFDRPFYPVLSLAPGQDATGVIIRVTADGTTPTVNSPGFTPGATIQQFGTSTTLRASPWKDGACVGSVQTFTYLVDSLKYDFNSVDTSALLGTANVFSDITATKSFLYKWLDQSSTSTISRVTSTIGTGSSIKGTYTLASTGAGYATAGLGFLAPYNQLKTDGTQNYLGLDSITFTAKETRSTSAATDLQPLRVNLRIGKSSVTGDSLGNKGVSYGWDVVLTSGVKRAVTLYIGQAAKPSWATVSPPSPLPLFQGLEFVEACKALVCSNETVTLEIDDLVYHFK